MIQLKEDEIIEEKFVWYVVEVDLYDNFIVFLIFVILVYVKNGCINFDDCYVMKFQCFDKGKIGINYFKIFKVRQQGVFLQVMVQIECNWEYIDFSFNFFFVGFFVEV